jgi:hypothetical protein
MRYPGAKASLPVLRAVKLPGPATRRVPVLLVAAIGFSFHKVG